MLKKLIPQSLFYRFLLIIIIPTMLSQLVATYMFYYRHWSNVTDSMTKVLVGEITVVTNLLVDSNLTDQKISKIIQGYHLLDIHVDHSPAPFTSSAPVHSDLLNLKEELAKKIPYKFNLNYTSPAESSIRITIYLPKLALTVISASKRIDNYTTYIFIMWMIGTTGIFLILSIIFIRNQIKSITRLSKAADKLGKGQVVESFKPEGAIEVRKAAIAFFKMKRRIEKQIIDRTRMLAGVSHDLRTPLTRMKLQLALFAQQEDVVEMQNDIIAMEHMIKGYLDFAKGEDMELSIKVNLAELLQVIINSYRKDPQALQLRILSHELFVLIKTESFKRAIYNIIDNAVKFAKEVRVTLACNDGEIVISIEDDGPNIPEQERKNVFRPFYRLEESRNLETGGVGLGLSIAKDAINFHGGTISLVNSDLGGLAVIIRLPM